MSPRFLRLIVRLDCGARGRRWTPSQKRDIDNSIEEAISRVAQTIEDPECVAEDWRDRERHTVSLEVVDSREISEAEAHP